MPAPYDKVYMLLDRQVIFGETVFNRYFFGCETVGVGNAGDLVTEFVDTIIPLLRLIQSNSLVHNQVRAFDVSDILDFEDRALALAGSNGASPALPTNMALGVRSSQPGYGIRPASKRFAGIVEDWVTGNSVIVEPTDMANLLTALGTALEGADGIYYPVIAQLPTPFVPPLMSVPNTYDALSWVYRPLVSTQNTRKPSL